MNHICQNIEDWGLTKYDEAFERQKELVDRRIKGKVSDTLVFTEHEAVYTMGKRKGSEDNLVWSSEELEGKGVTVSKTNRGGDITHHGPGQIVGYPIISLQEKRDLHRYLRDLEQVLINALGCIGLAASRRNGLTGIWLQNRKIAAIGVAVRRWVTYHGFALNVKNDLSLFEGIIPCGIQKNDGSVTSIEKELGQEVDMKEVKGLISSEFWKIFG